MRSFFLTCIFSLASLFAFSQELEPVKWSTKVESLGGDDYLLIFEADIDDEWNVYSQFTSDDGPVPTEITYESEGFELVGKGEEIGHKKEGFDKLFDTDVVKFLGDENFIIKQKIKNKGANNITGYLTYMTCNEEMCLPPTDFEFTLKIETTTNSKTTPKSASSDGTSKVTTPNNDSKNSNSIVFTPKTSITTDQDVQTKATSTSKLVEDISKKVTNQASETDVNGISEIGKTIVMNMDIGSMEGNSTTEEMPEQGGMIDPVQWKFDIKDLGGGNYELKYIAEIDDAWNVYSQFTSDDGPVPTEIIYEKNVGVEIIGEASEEGHRKEGPDPLFDNVNVIKYLGDEDFIITQKVKANKDSKLKGYLTYMTCDDGHCLPPTDVDFQVDFSKNYIGAPLAASTALNNNTATSSKNSITVGPGNFIDQRIPSIQTTFENPPADCGGEDQQDKGILWSFIFGFLGGLIALLTPCVFPMIPLTVSFFTKDSKRSGMMNGLIYGLSIIVIYVSMGLLITAFFGTEALNALSTNWIANTLFFLIFIFFAFSFFGYYEITLPSSWTTKTDSMADKGGLIGIFFMAFTLALVSFSCTGPIIGSAIVSAASSAVGPAIVMLGFSLGLAIPFGIFAAFPSWLNSLPKSGGWMNSVKVILGFLELAFAFKFLSVADMTSHWGFLRYELFMAIWVLVALGMTLYLFGFIKFPHDSPIKKLSMPRKAFAFGSLLLTIYLATGFMTSDETQSYNSLGITSGIAPPANYNFFLPEPEIDKEIKAEYPSYKLCANGIPCFKDYYEGLTYAKKQNKPVFLDFTGHGCVNCRKTEEFIWVQDEVKEKLKNDFVLVSLYVDDREKVDEKYISKRGNKEYKIRTVGNKWADFQIVNFKQNSQPLYVMMTNDEKVVSNPRGYHEGWEDYLDYLDCGLNQVNRNSLGGE